MYTKYSNSGRILCVICDADVDECKLYKPCNKHAECTNTEGRYKCKCKDGFMGNGYWCKKTGTYDILCSRDFSLSYSNIGIGYFCLLYLNTLLNTVLLKR